MNNSAMDSQDFCGLQDESRKLFYLSHPHDSDALVATIQSAGWQVTTSPDWAEARQKYKEQAFSAGILHLASEHALAACQEIDFFRDWEEFYLSDDCTQWIALLPPAALRDERVCELVSFRLFDFYTLPVDVPHLLGTLEHAHGMAVLRRRSLQQQLLPESEECGIIGQSPVMRRLLQDMKKISRVDAPALIFGESGTGKELTARGIHQWSQRRSAPFVAVNCASIPASLIQSELFGYEKGAFTGAQTRKIGRIEAAAGGTIFFDEIGDLPLELQGNLLRFLQEKTIERVGGLMSISVDVRVLAATHVNLEELVAAGRFRNDLYYRLNVLHLRVPALREREQDIRLLAKLYFAHFAAEKNPKVKGFCERALDAMVAYHWPGNVRELINRVRHAMVMSEHRLITASDLGLEEWNKPHKVLTLDMARIAAEKKAILSALHRTNYNVTQAACILGISRITLHRFLQRHGLQNDDLLANYCDLGHTRN